MKTILVSMMLFPLLAVAQTPPPYDPSRMPGGADMQKMMQQAQKMQVCMADIDQDRLEALSKEAQAMSSEIEELCAAGDEAAAVARALEFSREMRDDPVIRKLQECTKGMSQMMAQVMPVNPAEVESKANSGGICD